MSWPTRTVGRENRSKLDPEGLAAKYEFSRIPTFIVEQKGKEIGRIVERPQVTLEADLVNILQESPSE